MNVLLIFFALPIATIIISIALQKIFKCPALVAAIIFAIFLIVTFAVGNINYLVAAIVYTIISFITASLLCLISKILQQLNTTSNNNCARNVTNDLLTISSNCGNQNDGTLLTISSRTGERSSGCNCSSCSNNNGRNGVNANINVVPNNSTGRTGCICGRYRVQ